MIIFREFPDDDDDVLQVGHRQMVRKWVALDDCDDNNDDDGNDYDDDHMMAMITVI